MDLCSIVLLVAIIGDCYFFLNPYNLFWFADKWIISDELGVICDFAAFNVHYVLHEIAYIICL